MKLWFLCLAIAWGGMAHASEATAKLEEICHAGLPTTGDETRALIRASLGDVFRILHNSPVRSMHKFSALRFAVQECESEVAAPVIDSLMIYVEPVFAVCQQSQARCNNVLAGLLYELDQNKI